MYHSYYIHVRNLAFSLKLISRFVIDSESAERSVDPRVADVLFILSLANSVVNPYVYGSYASEMRSKVFKWKIGRGGAAANGSGEGNSNNLALMTNRMTTMNDTSSTRNRTRSKWKFEVQVWSGKLFHGFFAPFSRPLQQEPFHVPLEASRRKRAEKS